MYSYVRSHKLYMSILQHHRASFLVCSVLSLCCVDVAWHRSCAPLALKRFVLFAVIFATTLAVMRLLFELHLHYYCKYLQRIAVKCYTTAVHLGKLFDPVWHLLHVSLAMQLSFYTNTKLRFHQMFDTPMYDFKPACIK